MQRLHPMAKRPAGVFLALCIAIGALNSPTAQAEVKKSIAVAPIKYTQMSATKGWYSAEALTAQLITELEKTGRYRVVERENLEGIIGEQDLGTAGRTRGGSGPKTGDIEGAQLMIKGVITDAEEESSKGGGLRIAGIGGGGGKTTYRVSMDFRIYDMQTSMILDTVSVTAEQKKKEGGGGLNIGIVSAGAKGSKKDTTGEITRKLIKEALSALDKQSDVVGWKSRVIKVLDSGKTIVRGGIRDGLETNMEFRVFQLGEQIVDEETGEVLDEGEETEVGLIRITQVKDKVAYCEKVSGEDPVKGNVVRLVENKDEGS